MTGANVAGAAGRPDSEFDVVVVGAGNAASCAALAAREQGARVVMLEAAPLDDCGGNSRYTAGVVRFAFDGPDDLAQLVPDITAEERREVDFGSYSEEQFLDDMGRITQYRCDPELAETLVRRSRDTLAWASRKGVKFQLAYGRQSFRVDGKVKFWGGLAVEAWGGGPGLVDNLHKAAAREGIEIRYETEARGLIQDEMGVVRGVRVQRRGERFDICAQSVVLACGGFESSAEMRSRYLGPNWDLAKVRGTRYNTGLGLRMALDAGALPYGHWSGCHAVGWDQNAPAFGDLAVGDNFQKHSYPLGIMVNASGERFVDEGADFRNYTYAKYGAVILAQPGMFAWQIFDQKTIGMLRDEYRIRQVTKVRAATLEELVTKLEGVNARRCLEEIRAFNAAVQTHVPFDPAVKDGRGTVGLRVPKSNWAQTIDQGPFEAYAVTCGVTFTFGGVKVTRDGQVEDTSGQPIRGLFAAGEMVGGLFFHNYPGGSGLTSGAVFGRIAGTSAGIHARRA